MMRAVSFYSRVVNVVFLRTPSISKHYFSHHCFNTSIPAVDMASMIYFTLVVPFGSTKFTLKFPVTSSSAQRGRLLVVTMTYSMDEALLGVMYHPMVCHLCRPVAS